jgi:hypothetical protein
MSGIYSRNFGFYVRFTFHGPFIRVIISVHDIYLRGMNHSEVIKPEKKVSLCALRIIQICGTHNLMLNAKERVLTSTLKMEAADSPERW